MTTGSQPPTAQITITVRPRVLWVSEAALGAFCRDVAGLRLRSAAAVPATQCHDSLFRRPVVFALGTWQHVP